MPLRAWPPNISKDAAAPRSRDRTKFLYRLLSPASARSPSPMAISSSFRLNPSEVNDSDRTTHMGLLADVP